MVVMVVSLSPLYHNEEAKQEPFVKGLTVHQRGGGGRGASTIYKKGKRKCRTKQIPASVRSTPSSGKWPTDVCFGFAFLKTRVPFLVNKSRY